jgi:hypothetical protein
MRIITQNQGPIATLVGATIGIASLFGVFTYLGWDADQVGQFGGFALMIVSAIKTLMARKNKENGSSTSQGDSAATP